MITVSCMLRDKLRIRNLEIFSCEEHQKNTLKARQPQCQNNKLKGFPTETLHYSKKVSPEYAFHNSTIEYDILIQQRMSMRVKLVKLGEKQK